MKITQREQEHIPPDAGRRKRSAHIRPKGASEPNLFRDKAAAAIQQLRGHPRKCSSYSTRD